MKALLSRIASTLRRWFRREPAPGRWIDGGAFSAHGIIGFRPWVFPRRRFRLYVPLGYRRFRRAPLIVLLHGCRQTAAEFAQGTRIAALADAHGALVLMPDQADGANPYRCWNWFDARTAAGLGESAIVAAMIRKTRRRWRADPARILVAGMSSGAALAAIVGLRHRDLVRGVFVHSGIAAGAAVSAFHALNVMRMGPEIDVAAVARSARQESEGGPVPLLVVQGTRDDVVTPRHAAALARQYLALNAVAVPAGPVTMLPDPDTDERETGGSARPVRTREWHRGGRPLVRLVEIDGLGHAWSGGDASLAYNDAAGPDATAMLADWLATALS